MLCCGPGVVIGFGDVLTEYIPGSGISMVLNNLKREEFLTLLKFLSFYRNYLSKR
jgi:hypothetical protein